MKKLLLLLLLFVATQSGFAQTATALFNDYSDVRNASYTNVPGLVTSLLPSLLKQVSADKDREGNFSAVIKQVTSVRRLNLDECKKSVRRGFAKKVSRLASQGYEELTGIRNGDDKKIILARQDEMYVRELVVLIASKTDCTGILVTGKINREDLEALLSGVE